MQREFLSVPDALEVGVVFFHGVDINFQFLESLLRAFVLLVLERFSFNFQLDQAAFKFVHLLRL